MCFLPTTTTGLSLSDYAAAANALAAQGTMDNIITEPKMTILDFAGQRMYYHMHHLFITEQLSIYLVVFNVADDPHENLSGEDVTIAMQ